MTVAQGETLCYDLWDLPNLNHTHRLRIDDRPISMCRPTTLHRGLPMIVFGFTDGAIKVYAMPEGGCLVRM